jgi:hypothetical protein
MILHDHFDFENRLIYRPPGAGLALCLRSVRQTVICDLEQNRNRGRSL